MGQILLRVIQDYLEKKIWGSWGNQSNFIHFSKWILGATCVNKTSTEIAFDLVDCDQLL